MPDIKTVGIFSKPDVSAAVELAPKLIDRPSKSLCDLAFTVNVGSA